MFMQYSLNFLTNHLPSHIVLFFSSRVISPLPRAPLFVENGLIEFQKPLLDSMPF